MANRMDDRVRCSFCGKSQDQVKKLIAGTNNVFICDECIDLCAEILEEEFDGQEDQRADVAGINLLKPKEIKAFWMNMSLDRIWPRKCCPWLSITITSGL